MKKPPKKSEYIMDAIECARILTNKELVTAEEVESVLAMTKFPVSDGGKYLHWQDLLDRMMSRKRAIAYWSILKVARNHHLTPVTGLESVLGMMPHYMHTSLVTKTASLADRNCTPAGLNEIIQNYSLHPSLFSVFCDEESIASSQMEGAATTRIVAKKMLQEGRKARNESEKMIIANKKLMDFAWENRFENMTMALLLQFHIAASQGIDDDRYTPGMIRVTNDIYVEGRDGEIAHQPPPADRLDNIIEDFIAWINIAHSDQPAMISSKNKYEYIHPLVKACIMHFCMGFIHPFRDGNGRVARALCYWELFRSGYEAFRYISLSKLLKDAPIQYGEAYLKSETDSMDLTYFIDYQCSIFERAIKNTLSYAQESAIRLRDFDNWLFASGLRRKMTETQRLLINSVICMPEKTFTIKEVSEKLGISASAGRQNLESMVTAGIMIKTRAGGSRPDHYSAKRLKSEHLKTAIKNLLA
ncbi:Fic family protein [Sodalis praecaptivus]|uniref:Fic family protein n=1 Tax=Sodalis praecaptivus TaxID=1239307 RepID=UPI00280B1E7B|nr:Fic family protein [Sodalis praecaptivus]